MTKATQFAAIVDTARTYGRADSRVANAKAHAVEAYRAAGEESDALKSAFLAGFLIGALGLSGADAESKAREIMDKKGFGAKARATARRTEKQESAYTAARQALKRVRDAAGVKPAEKRGATATPGKGKDAQASTDKATDKATDNAGADKATAAKSTVVPAAATNRDAAAFLMAYANKNPNAFTGKKGHALKRAIAEYHAAICEPAH